MNCSNLLSNPKTRRIKIKHFLKKCIIKAKGQLFVREFERRKYLKTIFKSACRSYISNISLYISVNDRIALTHICEMYRSHRFDILGSGWVDAGYGSRPLGREGYTYDTIKEHNWSYIDSIWPHLDLDECEAKFARGLRQIIDREYVPIDWHRDLKSGFRWSLNSKNEVLLPGIEIKAVWDLGRMYHLPQLAIYSHIESDEKANCIREFKNQFLDFLAVNPVGKGVHWDCAMNAAIRSANLLIAYDLLRHIDTEEILSKEFHELFLNSIIQHGLFIEENLEVDLLHERNANHYLANLVGLMFIGAYLVEVPTSMGWWDYAREEFLLEINKQFMEDGTNFEASTSYHRLSGELMVYGAALIKRVDGKLPNWLLEKIKKAGHFSKAIQKNNGRIVQIGDNDSGRLLRLTPQGRLINAVEAEARYLNLRGYSLQYKKDELYFDEEILDHGSFLSAITGIIDCREFAEEKEKYPIEAAIVNSIAGGFPNYCIEPDSSDQLIQIQHETCDIAFTQQIITEINFYRRLSDASKWEIFPCFGLYCFKTHNFELFIYGGRAYKNGITSHMHNDILTYEFCLDGNDYFADPGTYLYTSLPDKRNQFRSRKAHNVPDYGEEPNAFNSVFNIDDCVFCHVTSSGPRHIELLANFKGIRHKRRVEILENGFRVTDWGTKTFVIHESCFPFFSNGYGRVERVNPSWDKIKITKR